uniref:Uncharacterized protein n=1 Tax=Romanomermis culicivorax TaxID=13658 RepID=A0A915KMY4_ROMCU
MVALEPHGRRDPGGGRDHVGHRDPDGHRDPGGCGDLGGSRDLGGGRDLGGTRIKWNGGIGVFIDCLLDIYFISAAASHIADFYESHWVITFPTFTRAIG